MKFRFEVIQPEVSPGGPQAPPVLVTVNVRPSVLTPAQTKILAQHVDGIDVLKLHYDPKTRSLQKTYFWTGPNAGAWTRKPVRIQASLPTIGSLLEAIMVNQAEALPVYPRGHEAAVKFIG
jgi:hypothetical protein